MVFFCTKRAMEIISWVMAGFAESKIGDMPGEQAGESTRTNYEGYLQEFKELLRILRICFYK